MNELDQFVKHKLKIKYYIRYADDFIILSENEKSLRATLDDIRSFLDDSLHLKLHPNKISIGRVNKGIDFLGYILLPHCRFVRTKTRRRIFTRIKQRSKELKEHLIDEEKFTHSFNSYLGVLSHANSRKLEHKLYDSYGCLLKR